jgi:CBS domain containing-hemolysin-like protein
VIEEIVGDIADEHDRLGARFRKRLDGSWVLSGLLRPDEAEAVSGVELPEHDDYDTVGGLLMQRLGRIPTVGDRVELRVPDRTDPDQVGERSVALTVERMDGLRVDRVSLTVLDEEDRRG